MDDNDDGMDDDYDAEGVEKTMVMAILVMIALALVASAVAEAVIFDHFANSNRIYSRRCK